jgi:hypothetical protein
MNNANGGLTFDMKMFIIAVQNKKKGEPNRTGPLSADPRTEPNQSPNRLFMSEPNRNNIRLSGIRG